MAYGDNEDLTMMEKKISHHETFKNLSIDHFNY